MADGYQYTPGTQFYLHRTQKTSLPNDALLNAFAGQLSREPPSPSKSPDRGSRGHSSHGMYNQGHQQGHNPRVNGNAAGRSMGVLYGAFQQSSGHAHQSQSHQHHVIQADHGSHGAGSAAMGHHSAFSGGVLSGGSPFANGLANGHGPGARASQGPPPNDHWADQLRLHKEAEAANSAMVEQNQANYYARLKAAENKGIGGPSPTGNSSTMAADGETEDLRRPTAIEKSTRRQDWHNLDLSGQGLRALSLQLFAYTFLQELYIASNKLTSLPAALGELRQLRLLEASNNQLSELPPELGMCTFLRQLLLFNNNIRTLPCELGSLHHLEMLGIEGNPLNMELKKEIMERGTKSLIVYLREQSPGKPSAVVPTRPRAPLTPAYSAAPPGRPKDDCCPGRRLPRPRAHQGVFVEHPLRPVLDDPGVRLHAPGRPGVGLPQGSHHGGDPPP